MAEEWRSLKGLVECGDYYEVSNLGRVRSIDHFICDGANKTKFIKGKYLSLKPKKSHGYIEVNFKQDGKSKYYRVHRLVALAFIPNPHNLPDVNHKKEFEKANNKVENLEWCDKKYNNNYGTHQKRSANTRRGQKRTDEQKKRMSESQRKLRKGTPVNVYKYPSMEFIGEFQSAFEAGEKLGVNRGNINKVLNKDPHYKHAGGYYFEWAN